MTTYAYDSAGNVISTTRAIVTHRPTCHHVVEKSSYDTKGNVTSRTNAVGDTSTLPLRCGGPAGARDRQPPQDSA
ncbi:hypothetical protein [Comamonas sp. JC664]|uniref:hypothetical protein n=1 Tax=Comamonas sp. JC664 TaxID=2801917 RepID=UPI00360F9850